MTMNRSHMLALLLTAPAATALLALQPTAHAQPVEHIKKILAPDGAEGDRFGFGVAYNGAECFIGAYEHAEGGVFASGAGYFFGENLGGPANWGFAVKRAEFAPGITDFFGFSVGMTAAHAAAGAFGDNTKTGAVFLYERDLGGIGAWGLRKKLLASDGVLNDYFGFSVDMDDGVVIAGATNKDTSSGAAYIFQQNFGGANNWGQSAKLTAPAPENDSFFGQSVSVDNGIAAVGAFQDDALGTNSGAAYVYEELPAGAPGAPAPRTGSWKFVKQLLAPGGGDHDSFGESICVKNGYVIVGAPTFQDGSGVLGAVFIFHRNQGGPGAYGFVKRLSNPDMDFLGDSFGDSVDLDGDILAVGVSQDGAPTDSAGAVYVYGKDIGGGDNWGLLARVKTPAPAHGESLGGDVDIEGDTIIAGAWKANEIATASGAVHVYRINSVCPEDLNGDGSVDTADLGILLGSFGMAGPGDFNLDGVIDTADLGILLGGFSATNCLFAP